MTATKSIYVLKNLVTSEEYGRVATNTLAGAQEYFDIMFPVQMGLKTVMLFELK